MVFSKIFKRSNVQSTPVIPPKESIPPAKLTVLQSVAFKRGAEPAARFEANSKSEAAPPSIDQKNTFYLEVSGFEVGTKIELINLSEEPGTDYSTDKKISLSFDERADVNPSGIDLETSDIKIAVGFFIDGEKAEKLGLKPGDKYAMRAIDAEGNISKSTFSSFAPKQTMLKNGVQDSVGTSEDHVHVLQGEGARKAFVANSAADNRPPIFVSENISFETKTVSAEAELAARTMLSIRRTVSGQLEKSRLSPTRLSVPSVLQAKKNMKSWRNDHRYELNLFLKHFPEIVEALTPAGESVGRAVDFDDLPKIIDLFQEPGIVLNCSAVLEPDANVEIQNLRTGDTFKTQIGPSGLLEADLSDVQDGDTLVFKATDAEGNEAKPLEIRYSKNAKDGRGEPLNVMNLRFQDLP